jgi:hypothetical protein
MRFPVLLTLIAALIALLLVIVIGSALLNPPRELIVSAAFEPSAITPNADGDADVTIFQYELSRSATITLSLTDRDGQTFVFRENQERAPGAYNVAFSGVVDGFVRPDDQVSGEVLRRLMPDGDYTWRLDALSADGETAQRTGTLRIADGDAPLPDITEFTVFPTTFTPNQDGIADRTQINVFLAKDAALDVFLQPRGGGALIYIPERIEETQRGEAGRHLYDFDGGVDLGANPPPDGDYTLVAFARDAVGQEVRRTVDFRIEQGGKPLAQIVAQPNGATVVFQAQPYEERYAAAREQAGDLIAPPDDPESLSLSAITMPVGDLLVFKLTIENYSDVPIRTSGPPPGTVYDWDQADSTLGWFEEAGAWRVGIDCTTAARDYPWRWAVGDAQSLTSVQDPDTGNTYLYLQPGERSVVWGAIRMTRLEARNPQNCWAGLIHEQVEISEVNRNVGARQIELIPMSESAIE